MSLPYREGPETSVATVVTWLVLALLVLGGTIADRQWNQSRVMNWADGVSAAPQGDKAMVYLPQRGSTPDVIVIKASAPETWQLCAQRADSDQMDCRSVKEARAWLRERPAVKR